MGNIHIINSVSSEETSVADANNNNLPGLMKRTCQRISFKRSKSSPKESKRNKKRLVLNTMPRCSSFDNLSNLLPSSKKVDNDPIYNCWKRAFEQRRPKSVDVLQNHLACMKRRVHNMSSAVSGRLTPKGFPAFIKNTGTNKSSLKVLQLSDSPRAARKIPAMYSDKQQQPIIPATHIQLPQKVTMNGSTFTTKESSSGIIKYSLALMSHLAKMSQDKQAVVIEQLYRDIKDMESRFDTKMDSFEM